MIVLKTNTQGSKKYIENICIYEKFFVPLQPETKELYIVVCIMSVTCFLQYTKCINISHSYYGTTNTWKNDAASGG